jgi:prepilin-type processing-associated H-X9-DG protein
LGPTHGKGGKVIDGAVEHDRMYGNLAFADGHVAQFADTGFRDGRWGGAGTPWRNTSVLRYHELEEKVFGGWLTKGGLW